MCKLLNLLINIFQNSLTNQSIRKNANVPKITRINNKFDYHLTARLLAEVKINNIDLHFSSCRGFASYSTPQKVQSKK